MKPLPMMRDPRKSGVLGMGGMHVPAKAKGAGGSVGYPRFDPVGLLRSVWVTHGAIPLGCLRRQETQHESILAEGIS